MERGGGEERGRTQIRMGGRRWRQTERERRKGEAYRDKREEVEGGVGEEREEKTLKATREMERSVEVEGGRFR